MAGTRRPGLTRPPSTQTPMRHKSVSEKLLDGRRETRHTHTHKKENSGKKEKKEPNNNKTKTEKKEKKKKK